MSHAMEKFLTSALTPRGFSDILETPESSKYLGTYKFDPECSYQDYADKCHYTRTPRVLTFIQIVKICGIDMIGLTW